MEDPRLGVELELQLLAYTAATAAQDPSYVCDLHHSSQQCWIPNPLSEARDRTASSWILVRFVIAEPWQELLVLTIWIPKCAVCLLAGSLPCFVSAPFRISECIVWPQASPLCVPFCVLRLCGPPWVTGLGSLIPIFWHLIDADYANCRHCSSLGSVCSIFLFSAETSGELILLCCSFPFFVAFEYFCGRHSGRLKRHVLLFLTQSRNI